MPDQTTGDRPRKPNGPIVSVNFRVTDTDPLLDFIARIVAVYENMAAGGLTIEQATDALGRVLAQFEGERL